LYSVPDPPGQWEVTFGSNRELYPYLAAHGTLMHRVAVQKSACLMRCFSSAENLACFAVGRGDIPCRFFHFASRLNLFTPAAGWRASNKKCRSFISESS